MNYGNDNPKKMELWIRKQKKITCQLVETPPTETPSCAKRWSDVVAIQREMEFVCAVCGQKKKSSVDLMCILGFLKNNRNIFVFALHCRSARRKT